MTADASFNRAATVINYSITTRYNRSRRLSYRSIARAPPIPSLIDFARRVTRARMRVVTAIIIVRSSCDVTAVRAVTENDFYYVFVHRMINVDRSALLETLLSMLIAKICQYGAYF